MQLTTILVLLCALAGGGEQAHVQATGASHVDLQDADLDVPELIAKYGYPVEVHTVTTSDGYILEMHRVPHGRDNNNDPAVKKKQVLVAHGLFSSSADFTTPGPYVALVYYLAEKGYDVWLGNCRGNYYSRNHTTLNPESSNYWNFSWEEIGLEDLSAMIDYILSNTGSAALHYIGHSQGTTAFFVLMSLKPAYNAKIISAQLMAPVAFFKYLNEPILEFIAKFTKALTVATIGLNEMFPRGEVLKYEDGKVQCKLTYKLWSVCELILAYLDIESQHFDPAMLPVFAAHAPAGAAKKQPIHFGQNIDSKHFQRYDFLTIIQNLIAYGTRTPPDYPLHLITAIVELYYSLNDNLTPKADVMALEDALPNAGSHLMSDVTWTHLDFCWATNAREMVYDKMIDSMLNFDTKEAQ